MKTLTFGTLILAMALPAAAIAHDRGGDRAGGPRGEMREMLRQADANGDGAIEQAEIDALLAERFADADANGDGAVSAEEFAAAAEAMRDARRADRQAEMFERLDADEDGTLSPEETAGRLSELVERMDRNGDGVLDADDRGRGFFGRRDG